MSPSPSQLHTDLPAYFPSYWANLRRKHTGRDEPHNVRYWGLGNEVWGEWQVGQQTAEAYATKARQWAHAIRLLDPTVKIIGCGETGLNRWDGVVLDELADKVDGHRYVQLLILVLWLTCEAKYTFVYWVWTAGSVPG